MTSRVSQYSNDFRAKVVEASKNGVSKAQIARIFNLGIATVNRWYKLEKETGSADGKKDFRKGHSHAITDLAAFRKFVEENNDNTCAQMAEKWTKLTGTKVSKNTILKYLGKIGFTRKKNLFYTKKEMKKKEKSF